MTVDPGSRGWNEHRHRWDVPAGTIQTTDLADGLVTTTKLVDGSVTGAKIAAGTITLDKIAVVAWTTFVVTLTQGVALTLTTAAGRYVVDGKRVTGQIDIVIGSTGTAGSSFVLGGLPVNARAPTGGYVLGHGRYYDGTTRYTAELMYAGVNSVFLQSHNVANLFGITPAVTAANTHQLAVEFEYEAA